MTLEDKPVERISAFLFHTGGDEDPRALKANKGKSFQGCIVLGMGFTFDDTNPDATLIAEMERLIAKDPRNRERIFPYIGGDEVNDSPTQSSHRYVVNFGDMSEAEAKGWPDLFAIVERKVKPQRLAQKREIRARYWWLFGERQPALQAAIRGLERVLVTSRVSNTFAMVFLPTGIVFSERLVVFAADSFSFFSMMQSRGHETWCRAFGSSLKDDLMYAPSDCFETFPFPENYEASKTLHRAGQDYYDFRAKLMVKNNEGLTKTYNRFHDPYEASSDIEQLRALHAAMDRAVLDAYGWTDIQPKCQFLLDYEEEEDEDNRRRKPWRCRWPDEVRDEILARLLALNAQRAEEERLAGAAAGGKHKTGPGGRRPKRVPAAQASFRAVEKPEE
jgi:hypothetical protein